MISITIPPGQAPFPHMKPGQRHLLDAAFAADYLKNGAPCEPEIYQPTRARVTSLMWELKLCSAPQRVLLIRAGGIGDLLFLTPSLAKLCALFPQHRFTLCSIADFRPVLSHPALEAIQWLDYPPLMAGPPCVASDAEGDRPSITDTTQRVPTIADFDFVIPLEETVERDDVSDAVTIFAEHLGLTLEDDEKTPLLRIPSDALAAAQVAFPRLPEQKRYGIQLRASHDCRTWPFNYTQATADLLLSRDPNSVVFLFGMKKDWPGIENVEHERIIWLPQQDLSLMETLAVLALMDGFIAPDSGLLYAAGALDIPSVGIFGPYQWQQRTVHSPSIRGINGHAECAPCHHKARTMAFPPGMPCVQAKCCIALAQVKPDRVVSLLMRQMESEGRRAKGEESKPQHLYALGSFFGNVLQRGDAHPELPRADEYYLGDWGGGSASIEEAVFLYGLVLALKPLNCLETGTETGWTAAHIAKALEENQRGHLTTLETNPKMAELARENLRQWDLEHRVSVVEIPSHDFLQAMSQAKERDCPQSRGLEEGGQESPTPCLPVSKSPRLQFDFALLDTHIELRARELELLIPHLAPNAFVCVHDTSPLHPMRGETKLLDHLRAPPGFDVIHLPTPRGLTMLAWRGTQK